MNTCQRCGRNFPTTSQTVGDGFCDGNCRKYADKPLKGTTGNPNRKMIPREEFDKMLLEQRGVCAICKKADVDRDLAVDHCHSTGKIRGLLCTRCNRGIGFFEDDEWLLRDAADYCERSKR